MTLTARRIAEADADHQRDFQGFQIAYDNYGSTHSDENRQICGEMWQTIRDAGLVKEKDVEQLFDVEAGTFLADRFVKGTCPECEKTDQAGDNCECGRSREPSQKLERPSTCSLSLSSCTVSCESGHSQVNTCNPKSRIISRGT